MTEKTDNILTRFRQKKVLGLPLIHSIGLVLGAIGGYLYYHYVGCVTGTCAITSNPWLSIVWGIAIGYLVSDLFYKKEIETKSDQ